MPFDQRGEHLRLLLRDRVGHLSVTEHRLGGPEAARNPLNRVGSGDAQLQGTLGMVTLTVNGTTQNIDADADTPLLWVLRDHLSLTGTKYGCGMALCGACTVHVDGAAVRSCVLPLKAVEGKHVTTIEGLSKDRSHPAQRAWIESDVPQCGYCQSGQIMAAAALLATNPSPSDADIDAGLSGNICRCGTYVRIRKAVHRAAELLRAEKSS